MLTEAFKYKIAPDYFAMLSSLNNYTHFCSVYEYNDQSEAFRLVTAEKMNFLSAVKWLIAFYYQIEYTYLQYFDIIIL